MYRQQAERLGERLAHHQPRMLVEIYRDESRRNHWAVRMFDPGSKRTAVVDAEGDVPRALAELSTR